MAVAQCAAPDRPCTFTPLSAPAFAMPDREALYAEFQPLVRRLIHKYGNDMEVRRDLAGEIYFQFCALLDAFDPNRGVPLRPYMVHQLSAKVYTFARQGWRKRRREVSFDMSSGFIDHHACMRPSEEWDDRLVQEQVLSKLPKVIAKLPTRQRQVVIWRYYDSRSFEEIALILNVQVATARSLLRHGLNNMRRRIISAA